MSLMWYDPFDFTRPSRLLNQQFGLMLDPEELLSPISPIVPRQYSRLLGTPNYYRPWTTTIAEKETGSSIACDNEKFQMNLDVQQFRPNEITVKISDDNTVIVEGKHEERPDEHGFISRQFVRKYILPKDHDVSRVQSSLSSDGVLTITAPKKSTVEGNKQREIPISQTGQPSVTKVEKKPEVKAECSAESKPVEKNIEIQKEADKKTEDKIIEIKKDEKPVAAPVEEKKAENIPSEEKKGECPSAEEKKVESAPAEEKK